MDGRRRWPTRVRRRFPARDSARSATKGFDAIYRIGNLALGPLAGVDRRRRRAPTSSTHRAAVAEDARPLRRRRRARRAASISLIQPVDLYSQVNRATKYGFLFIGFTFLALLMFDIIGGVRVSAVEYLLMGAAMVLFFVLLLAFAEVIGFAAGLCGGVGGDRRIEHRLFGGGTGSWRRRC